MKTDSLFTSTLPSNRRGAAPAILKLNVVRVFCLLLLGHSMPSHKADARELFHSFHGRLDLVMATITV